MRARDAETKLQMAQLKYRIEKLEILVEDLQAKQDSGLVQVQELNTRQDR